MSRLLSRRLPVLFLTGIALLVACGLALAKTHKATSCTARKGTTILETSRVRVYRPHKAKTASGTRLYACQVGSRHAYTIPLGHSTNPKNGQGTVVAYDGHLQSAGRYVAWQQTDSGGGTSDYIEVLDTRSGHYAQAGTGDPDLYSTLPDFVLNAYPTVVWLDDLATYHNELVNEWSRGTRKTLDAANAADKITELAMSKSGHQVYWLNNGSPKSARIP